MGDFVSGPLNYFAQEDANQTNADNVKNTNAQNYQMFQQSRGSQGSAVMPLYMKDFEGQLGKQLPQAYNSMTQTPYSAYQSLAQQYAPMQAAATSTANSIFDGGYQKQLQANAAPVQQARVQFSRQSAIDALNKTLGQINANQAQQGFTGDSYGNRMLAFGANKQMQTDVASANLQNLTENQGIANQALQMQLNNLNLPAQLQNNAFNMMNQPSQAYSANLSNALQPLTFLRIGAGQPFQNQNMPLIQPNSLGAAFGNAAGGAMNAGLNYYMQQQYANSLGNGGGAVGSPSSGSFGSGYGGAYDYGDTSMNFGGADAMTGDGAMAFA